MRTACIVVVMAACYAPSPPLRIDALVTNDNSNWRLRERVKNKTVDDELHIR